MAKKRWPSRSKARKMLRDGTIRGKKITKRQRGLFGLIASGKRPTRTRGRRRRRGRKK